MSFIVSDCISFDKSKKEKLLLSGRSRRYTRIQQKQAFRAYSIIPQRGLDRKE